MTRYYFSYQHADQPVRAHSYDTKLERQMMVMAFKPYVRIVAEWEEDYRPHRLTPTGDAQRHTLVSERINLRRTE